MNQPPKLPAVVTEFRAQLARMEDQFRPLLPREIPVERFTRVILTAVQREPKLLMCDRQSLFNAAMQAASDGLVPDGREGVLLPFSPQSDDDDGGKVRSGAKASWIPMVYGIREKVRRSKLLSNWTVQVIQQGDTYSYQLGDNPFVHHVPAETGGRDRPVIAAYSIATFLDGSKSYEIMNHDQLEDVRKKSRAKRGPWSDPIFYPEMCRKTVARLHSKQLPMSSDIAAIFARDDALYGLDEHEARTPPPPPVSRPSNVAAALDYFGSGGEPSPPDDMTQPATRKEDERGPQESDRQSPDAASSGGEPEKANQPRNVDEYRAYAMKKISAARNVTEARLLESWFASDQERARRNAAGLVADDTAAIKTLITEKIESFAKK